MNTGLTKSTIIYPGNVIKVSGKERDVAPQVAKAQAVAPAKASAQKTVTASAPVEKPESPESKLQKLQSQIDAYNTAIIAPDVTPENKINMERSKILLIAEKMKIEGTQRTQTFQAEQLARENTRKAEQLATDARKSEDATIAARSNWKQSEIVNEALAKQAPNQQRVKGIEDYIVQLKANPVKLNSTWNSTEVKNYEDKIHMAELDLKTAKSLVENDRQIWVHEKFIADNKDSLGLQSLTTWRNKEIWRLKENNKAILASINNSSTITAMRAIAEWNRAG